MDEQVKEVLDRLLKLASLLDERLDLANERLELLKRRVELMEENNVSIR